MGLTSLQAPQPYVEVVLLGLSGPAVGVRLEVGQGGKAVVGSGNQAQQVIGHDDKLAGLHFEIACAAGRSTVRDLDSSNGTFVNGRKIAGAVQLRHNDVINAGLSNFRVRIHTPELWADMTAVEYALLSRLYGSGERVWAVLDAAREDRIPAYLEACDTEHASLFEGPRARDLKMVAPHLALVPNGSRILRVLLREGWGNSWGVFFTSQASMPELKKHFQQFLTATDAAGRRFVYRFYDPRVLRDALPATASVERNRFFGPITRFVLEDASGGALELRRPQVAGRGPGLLG